MRLRKEKPNLETLSKCRLRVATHPHEVGIPSNQSLAYSGEYVPAPCTHRPSNQPSRLQVSLDPLVKSNLRSVRWVKSSQGIRRGTCGWITSFFIFNWNFVLYQSAFNFYNQKWARSPAVERSLCT